MCQSVHMKGYIEYAFCPEITCDINFLVILHSLATVTFKSKKCKPKSVAAGEKLLVKEISLMNTLKIVNEKWCFKRMKKALKYDC